MERYIIIQYFKINILKDRIASILAITKYKNMAVEYEMHN